VTVPLALLIAAAAAVAVALTLLFVLRRLAPENGFWGEPEPNHSGSAVGVLGGVFAILVAFVMFLALQNFINAKRMANAEATAVERQFHVAEAFHAGLRTSKPTLWTSLTRSNWSASRRAGTAPQRPTSSSRASFGSP
jgi:hypothetical protein